MLEAEVYIALLKNGPQTAYKVAKLIGKSNANVYKAVAVLAKEGAVEVMETDVKVCKAIPIETVVKQLQDSYKDKAERAVEMHLICTKRKTVKEFSDCKQSRLSFRERK